MSSEDNIICFSFEVINSLNIGSFGDIDVL